MQFDQQNIILRRQMAELLCRMLEISEEKCLVLRNMGIIMLKLSKKFVSIVYQVGRENKNNGKIGAIFS